MPEAANEPWNVFYSWQDDLPAETNRTAIKHALQAAIDQINAQEAMPHLTLDEATSRTPGSPNIPETIQAKIIQCKIFVADVTSIFPENTHQTPNPNVMFELGFAVAHLGWSRIIMLFNTGMREFYLPFDVALNRTSTYNIKEGKPDKKRNKHLEDLLRNAIQIVVDENPEKPYMVPIGSKEANHRRSDLDKLPIALKHINRRVILELTSEIFYTMPMEALDIYNELTFYMISHDFQFNDHKVSEMISEIRLSWGQINEYCLSTHFPDDFGKYIRFDTNSNERLKIPHEKIESTILDLCTALIQSTDKFFAYINEHYHEINLGPIEEYWTDKIVEIRSKL